MTLILVLIMVIGLIIVAVCAVALWRGWCRPDHATQLYRYIQEQESARIAAEQIDRIYRASRHVVRR